MKRHPLGALGLVAASHTPLMAEGVADDAVRTTVARGFEELAATVRAFQPDCIIEFAPDHFNGFFYDLMPSFCIGLHASSLGDWGGGTGPLPVDEPFARALTEAVLAADVDVAVSYRMNVDHGFVQIWERMFGSFDRYPIVPIFLNCTAPPLPQFRRARRLGDAVGRYALASGKRILFAASGGLSHDPPAPEIATAPPDVRERLIDGRHPTAAMREARETRVLTAGRRAAQGDGPCLALNPVWDREVLDLLSSGELERFDAFEINEVRRVAGRGAAEVLCWVAAFGALAVAGRYTVREFLYEPIPGWIAGMAMVSAAPSPSPASTGQRLSLPASGEKTQLR